jgi:hypothetical protein
MFLRVWMEGLLKPCDVDWSSSTSLPCDIALDTEAVEATRQEYVLFLRASHYDGRPSVRRHEPDFRVKPEAFRPPMTIIFAIVTTSHRPMCAS